MKRIMTVVVGLGGRCFKVCMLYWDCDDWMKYLRYVTSYFYRELGRLDLYCLCILVLK